jgi:hypothetical protein
MEADQGLAPRESREMSAQPPKTTVGLSKRSSTAIAPEFRGATYPSALTPLLQLVLLSD